MFLARVISNGCAWQKQTNRAVLGRKRHGRPEHAINRMLSGGNDLGGSKLGGLKIIK